MFYNILASVADNLNASVAAIRLLISILLGFPIALIHRYYLFGRNPVHQNIFFTTCSVLIGCWNYGFNMIHSATALCVTYAVLKLFRKSSLSILLTFLFNMIYLSYGYYSTSTKDYDIKWTMPQCVLTLRLIGLAFNLWDGQKPEDKLSVSQKKVALKSLPTFLEVAAYMYFPGSFLVGPQFSMKRYLDYINGRLLRDDSKKEELKLPDCLQPGMFRAFLGVVYVILFQLGSSYVPDQYLLDSEFREQSLLKRHLLIGFWGHVALYKYIGCWLLTEAVCTTFGLTYSGKDEEGRPLWNGCENVKLSTFESATRFNHYILSFNINTNNWCAEYIYKRVKFLGSKLYSQFVTLLFLAVWHGFHSGYYVCFFLEFIIMYAERDFEGILAKSGIQQRLESRSVTRILSWIIAKIYTFVFMGYCMVCFVYLSYPRYNQVYGSVYYSGHIIYLSYPLVSLLIKRFFLRKNPALTR